MNSKKGFTIIELIVVIAVVSIIPTIVIVNLPKIKLQFSFSRVAYKVAQDLRRSQDKALSQVIYRDSQGAIQAISGYGTYIDISGLGNKKYIIYADKSPGNQQYDASDYIVETIDFSQTEPGIVIKQLDNVAANKASINTDSTSLNTQITQLNPGQNNVNIVIALESDLTKTRTISVNTAGLVENK